MRLKVTMLLCLMLGLSVAHAGELLTPPQARVPGDVPSPPPTRGDGRKADVVCGALSVLGACEQ